jgi:hypothetical protein
VLGLFRHATPAEIVKSSMVAYNEMYHGDGSSNRPHGNGSSNRPMRSYTKHFSIN